MVARASSKPATYADLEALPPNQVGEILRGVLYAFPRPAIRHAHAATVLGVDLGAPFGRGRGGPGGWLLLHEPELHFGDDVLVPDRAGWRRERMQGADFADAAFLTLAPDWLCEVLSPSTEAVDRGEKMPIYASRGVGHVWLLDPAVRTLEIFRLDGESYRVVATHRDDAKVRAEPFDAVELELSALWAR
jgi:Uma2 family endonuclease